MKPIPYSVLIRCAAAVMLALTIMHIEGQGYRAYGWFSLLRWGVCAAGVYAAVIGWKQNTGVATVMAAIAILFNPIAKITMARLSWNTVDTITAIVMVASCFWIREHGPVQST